ncbi:hypothetical protein CC1G_15330 [Coprinopsis cinerea okayama7|uniref:Uncharacterized protein n=1 Tax=Coprinopsis cinerea (strain Okayama-7 / 130 / ATCC MYA-4618 / FGSC 9003) TaxID=240176 RepID=D6RQ09_COPC7|nr:hypothetical protein CC1G_15330 [Coprinopsis cinerea okayama7\|eukprot:XP_002910423.1 hypothetical protein CC1G_15330 [Coprinopsis cinerea okayama7\
MMKEAADIDHEDVRCAEDIGREVDSIAPVRQGQAVGQALVHSQVRRLWRCRQGRNLARSAQGIEVVQDTQTGSFWPKLRDASVSVPYDEPPAAAATNIISRFRSSLRGPLAVQGRLAAMLKGRPGLHSAGTAHSTLPAGS